MVEAELARRAELARLDSLEVRHVAMHIHLAACAQMECTHTPEEIAAVDFDRARHAIYAVRTWQEGHP